ITEISGPCAPSRRVRMSWIQAQLRSFGAGRQYAVCQAASTPQSISPSRSDLHHRMSITVEERERVVVRFAGDSGDGMQLTGDRFTNATALLGNDLATLPDFPAEIRAPAGTVHGVSAFQIQFA